MRISDDGRRPSCSPARRRRRACAGLRGPRLAGCSATTRCHRVACCSTGTGLVPPDDFTLLPGTRVEIHVPGIGTLDEPRRRTPRSCSKGARDDRDPHRCPCPELHRRRMARLGVAGETYEKRNPWRPPAGDGRVPGLRRRRREGGDRGCAHCVPGVGSLAGGATRGLLPPRRGRDRGPGGAGRAGHDGGDGQAAA